MADVTVVNSSASISFLYICWEMGKTPLSNEEKNECCKQAPVNYTQPS